MPVEWAIVEQKACVAIRIASGDGLDGALQHPGLCGLAAWMSGVRTLPDDVRLDRSLQNYPQARSRRVGPRPFDVAGIYFWSQVETGRIVKRYLGLIAATALAGAALLISAPAGASSGVGSGWGKPEEVPGTAALNQGGKGELTSVSCASAGSCSAGGYYAGSSGSQAFVVSRT